MKRLISLLLLLLPLESAFSKITFYADVGASYVRLGNTKYAEGTPPVSANNQSVVAGSPYDKRPFNLSLSHIDESGIAPFVAIGSRFSDWFSVKVAYQNLSNVDAAGTFGYLLGGDVIVPQAAGKFSDDLRWVILSPEFDWKLSPTFAVVLSPELNWVSSKERLETVSGAVVSQESHHGTTAGGSVGAIWTLNERWALTGTYRYLDLGPSRDRTAQMLSAALRFHF